MPGPRARLSGSIAAATVLAIALTGCGAPSDFQAEPPAIDMRRYDPDHPGNGLWLLSGDDIIHEVTDAMRDAGDVTYSGSFTELIPQENADAPPQQGRQMSIDFTGGGDGMRASIEAGDISVTIVSAEGKTYVRGNDAYAAHIGIPEVQQGYVCSLSADALLEEWEPLLDPASLVEELLSASPEISVMEPEYEDETTEVVVGQSESPFGTLTVSAVAAPLPSEFDANDPTGDGSFTFREWGTPVGVQAPEPIARDCSG